VLLCPLNSQLGELHDKLRSAESEVQRFSATITEQSRASTEREQTFVHQLQTSHNKLLEVERDCSARVHTLSEKSNHESVKLREELNVQLLTLVRRDRNSWSNCLPFAWTLIALQLAINRKFTS